MPSSQIICVTHLAQVACHAEQHIRVSKANNGAAGGRVTTRFQPLESDEDRITEVAAMMGMGKEVATNVLAAARQNGSGSGAAGAGDDVISQDTNPYLP
jgi:DNA repair protein RecN (Recombination protein N)